MSKRNKISYGVLPEDEGSDMDVSSDDDGTNVYPASTPRQTRHNDSNHDNRSNVCQEQLNSYQISHDGESSVSRLTSNPATSENSVAQRNMLAFDYAESDIESTNSFHTAPSSPIDLTLSDEQDNENADQQPDLIEQLQKEHDELTKELKSIALEEKRLGLLLEHKKANLEAIRVRALELQVRRSIQRNRKAVIIPPKDKGKKKASIDTHYDSFSGNSEDDEDQPPKKTMAVINTKTGQPEKKAVEEPNNETRGRNRKTKEKGRIDSSVPQDVPQNESIKKATKKSKTYQQLVKQSQIKGNTSIGQMKMFLCDLFDKFMEDDELTAPQRGHYKELVKKIAKYDEDGDDYVPTIGPVSIRKRKTLKAEPKAQLMLPKAFYGHPERLNFGNLYVDRIKLLDALNCSRVDTPKNVRRATAILNSKGRGLTIADFQDIIDSHGEIMKKDELAGYIGLRKLNKLTLMYKKVIDPSFDPNGEPFRKVKAKSKAKMLAEVKADLNEARDMWLEKSQRNTDKFSASIQSKSIEKKQKHTLYSSQRDLEEALKDAESPSPEAAEPFSSSLSSNDSTPFIADSCSSATSAVDTPDTENATDQLLANSRPITTISYVPNKTSFIRQIIPAAQQPSKEASLQRLSPKDKRNPVSPQPPQPPQPLQPRQSPQPQLSQSSQSVQISLPIPSVPAPLNFYDGSPPSISSNPTATTAITATENQQANTPNQKTSSFFQPYRSALDSLGVSQNSDVSIKKTGILCRAESNGGVCNDKFCPDMHFSDFA
ncbi:hypothetical protein BD408DRAFT_435739 [Parasitella parasitica]|nr:hypothetical protein BD408DRAFT_435739 [Parasitella parasitica]